MLLPRRHQEMLPNFNDHVKKVEKCIEENQNFLFDIVSHTNEMFENRDHTRISSVRCINYCFLLCPVYATQPFFYRVFCLRGEGVSEVSGQLPPGQFAPDNSPLIFMQLAPHSFIHYRTKRAAKYMNPRLNASHTNYSLFIYPLLNKLLFVLLSTTDSEDRPRTSAAFGN